MAHCTIFVGRLLGRGLRSYRMVGAMICHTQGVLALSALELWGAGGGGRGGSREL